MKGERYPLLDALRGFCVVSMVCYHGLYDWVVIGGLDLAWYRGLPGYLWQQSICWCFIVLSGLCWNLSRRHAFRGVLLVGCGAVVSLVTWLVLPQERILFGILTLLGLSALLVHLLALLFEKLGWRLSPAAGLGLALALFFLTRDVPQGWLGFEGLRLLRLPNWLYRWNTLAVLGFPGPSFHSSDYFPLLPWFFLYLAGYFLWGLARPALAEKPTACPTALRPLCWVGRHSLWIYLAHQPVLYGLFLLSHR